MKTNIKAVFSSRRWTRLLTVRVVLLCLFGTILSVPLLPTTAAEAVTFSPWTKHVKTIVVPADSFGVGGDGDGLFSTYLSEFDHGVYMKWYWDSYYYYGYPAAGYSVSVPRATRYGNATLSAVFKKSKYDYGTARLYASLGDAGNIVSAGASLVSKAVITRNVQSQVSDHSLFIGVQGIPSDLPYVNNVVDIKEFRVRLTYWTGYPVPSKTLGVVAAGGDGKVFASWVKNSPCPNGYCSVRGNRVLGFQQQIRRYDSSTKRWTTPVLSTTASNVSSKTFAVANGSKYQIRVRAYSRGGYGAWSTPHTSASGVPLAPSRVQLSPSNRALEVSWTSGAGNGSRIRSYQVLYRAKNANSWGAWSTRSFNASARKFRLTGVSNGRNYQFVVKASNKWYQSRSSNYVSGYAYTRPDSPTLVQGVGGQRSVQVSWRPPKSNGGSAITSYEVLASPGGMSCAVEPVNPGEAPPSSCRVDGLLNGSTYTFTVIARNRYLPSLPSLPSSPIAARSVPGSPTTIRTVASNQRIDVSWVAPVDDGGFPISAFTARATPGGNSCRTTGATECVIEGLANGTAYTVEVVAENEWGLSLPSSVSNATPGTVPDAPGNLLVDPGNGLIKVSWAAPVWNGGSAVTSYAVSDGQGGHCEVATGSSFTCTIKGLTNGNTYGISVIAINRFGSSTPSQVIETSPHPVAPVSPAKPAVAPKDGQVEVSWLPPSTDGGSPVTGYVATASPGGAMCSTTGELSCIVSSLVNGTSYTFTVVAINTYGTSLSSTPSSVTTPATKPAPPTVSSVTTTLNSATATWAAPSTNGGSPVIQYTATLSPGGQTCTTSSQSCTITSIQDNHAEYQVTVVAGNAASVSNSSSPFTFHLRGATQVSAGSRSACALLNSGDAACWGFGATGALGNGTDGGTNNSYQSAVPLRVVGLPASLKQVSVGDGSACALDSVGSVWCWGTLIGSISSHILTPAKVVGIPDAVSEISAGSVIGGKGFECALTVNGAVYCWGGNSIGQLGNGKLTSSTSPVPVYGLTNGVTQIASGGGSTCAVLIGGAVKCWGRNTHGQLGNGSLIDSSVPVGVTGLPGPVRQISVGSSSSCAVLLSNDSYCWGSGSHGQLGDGASTASPVPVRVALPDATVRSITVGGSDFACAISTVNLGSCWGIASTGQLGRPFALDQSIPQTLLSSDFPDGLESISASKSGWGWACGILTSGAIKCWGNNIDGSLGNGSKVDSVVGAGGVSPTGVVGIS